MKKFKDVLWTIGCAICITILACRITGVISCNIVEGSSMYPTYEGGDYVIGTRFEIWAEGINRGDVVIAKSPTGNRVIKRVIGLPGETIEIRDGKTYIDGELLEESYINSENHQTLENVSQITLSENEYWIMGDNRDNSLDSRNYGAIEKNKIRGIVFSFKK